MSDRDDVTLAVNDDLALIVRYLNRELDSGMAEQVAKRLDEDPAFYSLAEPLLYAWSVPPRLERKPRPAGELEREWDKFTKKAGFRYQRRKARRFRLWMLAIILAVSGISGFLYRGRIQSAYRDWRDYAPVTGHTGWVRLRDHMQVRLEPDARLRAAKELQNDAQFVKLEAGRAHFRVELTDSTTMTPDMTPVVVRTRAGHVFSGYGDFTVTVRGDTTDVRDNPSERTRYIGFMPFPSMTMVRDNEYTEPVRVQSGELVRLIRGQSLQRMK